MLAFLEDIKTRYNAIFNGIRAFIARIIRDTTGSALDFQACLNENERKALYVCINEKDTKSFASHHLGYQRSRWGGLTSCSPSTRYQPRRGMLPFEFPFSFSLSAFFFLDFFYFEFPNFLTKKILSLSSHGVKQFSFCEFTSFIANTFLWVSQEFANANSCFECPRSVIRSNLVQVINRQP